MITTPSMYRRAAQVVADLERKAKDGTATDAERERLTAGRDHLLVYDWAADGTPAVEVVPRVEPEPPHPLVVAFCDWWERVHESERWRPDDWRVGLLYWWHPRPLAGLTWDLESGVEEELALRDAERERANEGMVVTDLEAA